MEVFMNIMNNILNNKLLKKGIDTENMHEKMRPNNKSRNEHDGELTSRQVEDTKKYSIIDASAYNVMAGFGEQYITPFAIKLGASNFEIGILSSIPSFIGSLFQIVGARLTDHYRDRKKVVLFFAFMQSIMYLPLFIVPFLTKSILLLTIIFSLYLICSNAAAPAWNSWIGAVIPDSERAEYFSRRNRISLTFLPISVLLAGLILNYFTNINKPDDIWLGFGILFGMAFLGRMVSWYYLTKQFEPKYEFYKEDSFSFKDFLKRLPETNFGNFVMFRSLVAFAVMIASPFFAVYMLRDLGFNYIQYTIIVLVPMLIKVLTVKYWGKYSRKIGTRNIMTVSAFLIAFIPLGWFIAGYFFFGHPIIFFIIMASEMISGFAWAGFELSTFNYILETVSPPKRARAIAYFNIVFGAAVLVGGLLGSYLAISLPISYHGISILLMVFIISAVARFMVPLLFLSKLKEVVIKKDIDETKLFIDLVISRPLHSALHQTANIMLLAEEGIAKAANGAKRFEPIIGQMIEGIDRSLEHAEPIRKAIEPRIIRDSKKKHYEELIKSHERINKDFHYRKKPKR